MLTNRSMYVDTFPSGNLTFDLESNSITNQGWFSEGSVQSILYDLYDSNNDGTDVISLGLGPIYRALTATDYKENNVLTSIFSFVNSLLQQTEDSLPPPFLPQPVSRSHVNALTTLQGIDLIIDDEGSNETNSSNITNSRFFAYF